MAEKEYIEREKLNDLLGVFCMSESLYEILQTIPTADVQPVKHGRWKPYGSLPANIWECSECNGLVEVAHYCNKCYYDFCNNCGAKMDGGEK